MPLVTGGFRGRGRGNGIDASSLALVGAASSGLAWEDAVTSGLAGAGGSGFADASAAVASSSLRTSTDGNCGTFAPTHPGRGSMADGGTASGRGADASSIELAAAESTTGRVRCWFCHATYVKTTTNAQLANANLALRNFDTSCTDCTSRERRSCSSPLRSPDPNAGRVAASRLLGLSCFRPQEVTAGGLSGREPR